MGEKKEGEEKVKYAVSKTRNSAFYCDRKKLVVFEERERQSSPLHSPCGEGRPW
jgi:hypothetical protein